MAGINVVNKVEVGLTEARLFKAMCDYDVGIMNCVKLISVPALAERFCTSKYRIRKLMKNLQLQGLVDSGIESFYSDWCEQQILVRGFYVTEKGKIQDWRYEK